MGDIIRIKPHHLPPAREIVSFILPQLKEKKVPFTITRGGESGSGKSTLSLAIEKILEEKGYKSFIFYMDGYFKLSPKDNHYRQLSCIKRVGAEEVNLSLLQQHMDQTLEGAKKIKKPLVHYRENKIREVIVELDRKACSNSRHTGG